MATISISCSASGNNSQPSAAEQIKAQGYDCDSFTTPAGRNVTIFFIKHASLIIDIDGYVAYIDPVTIYGNDFSKLPKANLLMVTHSHHDHLDPKAVDELANADTKLIGGGDVAQQDSRFTAVKPGDVITDTCARFTVTCTPAYNISEGHTQFHPKERGDVGYLLDIDGLRIYVAGDTEDILELADLKDIDVAFLPVNQPYTMTPQQAIHAIEMIKPKIVYPYHYSETDLTPIVKRFAGNPNIEVRIRQLQ